MKSETRNLPVKLTREELDQRRDKLANLHNDIATNEADKKRLTTRYATKIKELNDDANQIAREIRTRSEYRDVEVYRQKNFELNVEEVIRADTLELVDSRAMQPSERQMSIHEVRDTEAEMQRARERAEARKKEDLAKEAEAAAEEAASEAADADECEVEITAPETADESDSDKITHLRSVVRETQKEIAEEDAAEGAE